MKQGNIVEKLQEKSAYTQKFINESEVILGIFEGKLKKFNIKERKFTLEKNVKAMIDFMKSGNNIINPPYLIDSVVDDINVYVALMNGVIISLRQSNFKKNCVKTVHYNSIMKL